MCIYKSALSTEREAVAKAKIVIRRLTDERNDVRVCEALFDKACKIASEFDITASSSRIVGRQKNRATYPVDNLFDCWSSKQRRAFFVASYLTPANLLSLTPEIVDRLFNAY